MTPQAPDEALTELERDVVLELAQGTVPRWVASQYGMTEPEVRALGYRFGWPKNTRQIKAVATRIRAQRAGEVAAGTPAEDNIQAQAEPEPEGQPQPAAEATAHSGDGVCVDCGRTSAACADAGDCSSKILGYSTWGERGFEPAAKAFDPDACAFAEQHRHWGPRPNRTSGGLRAGATASWNDVVGRLTGCPCGGGLVVDPDVEQPEPAPSPADLADAAALLDVGEQLTGPPPAPSDRATFSMPLGRLVDADGRETVLGVVEIDVQLNVPGVLEALAGELFTGREGGHLVIPTRIERRLTPDGAAALRALAALLPRDGER